VPGIRTRGEGHGSASMLNERANRAAIVARP
jgi:hypothetical protein